MLETKKIDIPGYPDAFNPSIIRWQNRNLLSFRIIPDPKHSFESKIGLVWLDDEFQPVENPQLLVMRDIDSTVPYRAEDARLILVENQLWIVYCDNLESTTSRGGYRVYIARVCTLNGWFYLDSIECLSHFEGQSQQMREKNWVPFDYQGHLLLAYSLVPHKIFWPELGTGECKTICSTISELNWAWGILRGGTPALKIDDDEYLAFFHSSIEMASDHSDGKIESHYFLGAYTFSSQPPFAIQRISPEPIVAKGFYSGTDYKPYWKPVRVVFPCGFVMDSQFIWISYGRQDREIWIVKLDRKELLNHLSQIKLKINEK